MIEHGRAFAAHLALKSWLARHPSPAPAVLLAAGETALAAHRVLGCRGLTRSDIR
jgi:D-alanine-D-alanine ligase-like ATP-grasp enzyme